MEQHAVTTTPRQVDAPPDVAALAAQHELGAFLDVRKGHNPLNGGLVGIAAGIGGMLGLFILGPIVGDVLPRFLNVVLALSVFVIAAFALALGALQLVSGFRSFYLFADGLILRKNRSLRAVAFTDLKEARFVPAQGAGLPGVVARTRSGEELFVPVDDERDEFGARIVRSVSWI